MSERFAKYLLVLIPIILLLILCMSTTGGELEVGPGKTYSTIQEAINNSNAGDTISVYSKTYHENIFINKTLSIIGVDGISSTIINGRDQYKETISIDANNVQISGFTIKNEVGTNNPRNKACIKINYANGGIIRDNIIKNGLDGINLVFSSDVSIYDNTIEDTYGDDYDIGNGIYLISSNDNQIYDNIIRNHVYKGVYLQSSSNNDIYRNTISGNFEKGIYLKLNSDDNIIYDNEFLDNEGGHAEEESSSNTWHHNSQGNYWDDYDGYDESPEDGIGDEPYDIPGGTSQDLYPLGNFIQQDQSPIANIVSISPNPATVGDTIHFEGSASDDGTISQWQWKANGNKISSSEDFSYSSLSAGTYTITFRVWDDKGNPSNTDLETLKINSAFNNPPSVTTMSIMPTSAKFGDTIYFSGDGSDQDSEDSVAGYSWTSNLDGFLYNGKSFTRKNLSVGTHTISFKVRDTKGSWSSPTTKTITISPDLDNDNNAPTPDVGGPYEGSANSPISFDGSGSYDSDEGDSITRYYWTFGDDTNAEGATVTHTYSESGTYTVELTVTDSNGLQTTKTSSVTVSVEGSGSNGDSNNNGDEEDSGKIVIPGFEIILIVVVIIIIISLIMLVIKR